jgi:phosphate/sulfate permease
VKVDAMSYFKATVGGLVGGAIGAAIWATITILTNYEIGLIASAIGAAVGFGVRLGAGEESGEGYGGLAIGLSLLAILGGKYVAYQVPRQQAMSQISAFEFNVTDDDMICEEASTIVGQRIAANKPVYWPAGKSLENAESISDYPQDVAQEATAKWNALAPAEREKQKAEKTKLMKELVTSITTLGDGGFVGQFTFYDLLWIGLAGLAAFKLGSGMASDDD